MILRYLECSVATGTSPAVAVFLFTSLFGQTGLEPTVDILIPKDMPIQITAERVQNDEQILKYIIKRSVPRGVQRGKIIVVMADKSGTILYEDRKVGAGLNDPMSLAIGDGRVARILLVVEWIETDRGRWVIESKTQELDAKTLLKRGANAPLRSRFISK